MRVLPEHKFKASLDQLLLHILELEDTYMLTHLYFNLLTKQDDMKCNISL